MQLVFESGDSKSGIHKIFIQTCAYLSKNRKTASTNKLPFGYLSISSIIYTVYWFQLLLFYLDRQFSQF